MPSQADSDPPPPGVALPFPLIAPTSLLSSPSAAELTALRSSVCPYSCNDELMVGAFKGAFAGSLWGGYSFWRNLMALPYYDLPGPIALTAIPSIWAAAAAAPPPAPSLSNNPLAGLLTSPHIRLFSPLLVYPVKFASLYALYRGFSCSACYLSTEPSTALASLTANVLHSTVSASLAGFVVSLPHLSPRLSLMHVLGCGGLGAVAAVAQPGVAWLGGAA